MNKLLSARGASTLALLTVLVAAPAAAQDAVTQGQTISGETPNTPLTPPPEAQQQSVLPATSETMCADAADDDADGMVDCADADCFASAQCSTGGRDEATNALCGDWIDNDGDGAVDCDDDDCSRPGLTACSGSYRAAAGSGQADPAQAAAEEELPELGPGMTVEDLVGRGGDADGERNDELCADGIDNDLDGRVDCADFGCRFDSQVTVCQGTPGLRFSVVTGVGARADLQFDSAGNHVQTQPDAGFTLLQLRALGPIPFINNSFFLISIRADDRVRVTFANFQIPISGMGHYLSLNSGFGGLSSQLIISAARHPLLEPAFYMTSVFEQGNGGQLDLGGPIDPAGVLRFRVFGAAGSGEFTGNIGGRFFRSGDQSGNFSAAGGAQLVINAIGQWDRFDSPYLYVPAPMTLNFWVGAKFDQRPDERFISWHAFGLFRLWHFLVRGEYFSRYVFDYDGMDHAFNIQLSALIVPRVLMFAADAGGYYRLMGFGRGVPESAQRQLETFQWRAAFHWFFFRNVGILSALYGESYNEVEIGNPNSFAVERTLRLEARYRF